MAVELNSMYGLAATSSLHLIKTDGERDAERGLWEKECGDGDEEATVSDYKELKTNMISAAAEKTRSLLLCDVFCSVMSFAL